MRGGSDLGSPRSLRWHGPRTGSAPRLMGEQYQRPLWGVFTDQALLSSPVPGGAQECLPDTEAGKGEIPEAMKSASSQIPATAGKQRLPWLSVALCPGPSLPPACKATSPTAGSCRAATQGGHRPSFLCASLATVMVGDGHQDQGASTSRQPGCMVTQGPLVSSHLTSLPFSPAKWV